CIAPPTQGQACDPSAFIPCDTFDLWCDPGSPTCALRKPIGATCDPNTMTGDPGCPDYGYCDPATSVCKSYGNVGAVCDDMSAGCLLSPELGCVNGRCKRPEPVACR